MEAAQHRFREHDRARSQSMSGFRRRKYRYYDEPIFDQGHMANDADMKDDLTEQIKTYIMSNMSAQYCRFNRGVWLSLEDLGRAWAKEYGGIYFTSGAIFDFNARDARDKDNVTARMGSRNQKARVAIPSDYYKKVFLRNV
jgi:DNA/RNA endonuclease G (NUC1)